MASSAELFEQNLVAAAAPINESLGIIIWNSVQPPSSSLDPYNENTSITANTSDHMQFHNLFHQPIHLQFRIAVLWFLAILGSIGNVLVIIWICGHRNWKSRINLLIFHLTLTDILVIVMAICPQLAWEYAQRQWEMGNAACKIFKFFQLAVISVSNYMVLVLAIDRYCAIRRPMKKPFTVGCLTGTAWSLAVIVNIGTFYLYETNDKDGKIYCRSKLYDFPKEFMQAYLTAIAFLVFVLPLLFICFTYARIFQKIANRKKSSIKSGKIQLQATSSSTLPKAKIKTFKLTVVILTSFLICNTPYFVVDMWRVYASQELPSAVWGILGALAVANSCTNPYVFLGFNSTKITWWNFVQRRQQHSRYRTQSSSGITLQTNTDTNTICVHESALKNSAQCSIVVESGATSLVQMGNGDASSRQLIYDENEIKSDML